MIWYLIILNINTSCFVTDLIAVFSTIIKNLAAACAACPQHCYEDLWETVEVYSTTLYDSKKIFV